MKLRCIFGHKWQGCVCENCGKYRDEEHVWVKYSKCKICGMKPNKETVLLFKEITVGMGLSEVIKILGNPVTTLTDSELNSFLFEIPFASNSRNDESWLYKKNGIRCIIHIAMNHHFQSFFGLGTVKSIELYPNWW